MLELIHADICGTISPPTPAGNRYFFLLVDDFGRVMWVYMLKSKDEALGMFQKFHVLVENETGLNHHFTKPYSPQQNGVVERQNRSVIKMAKSMMKSMQVPDALRGEAVCQAVYIQNRVPTKTLGDTTPYERWSVKKPNLEHLRVFGCIAYLKVLRGHQQKNDSRSEMLVHLGTETRSKAYRLLDPVSGRIRVSRDVRF
ncbi:zinc finger, CCHC-type containing protein [Tanacetum coccineum]